MASLSSSSLVLVSLFLCISFFSLLEAKEILVGGKSGSWEIPSSQQSESSLTQWARTSRFVIGDTLVFDDEKDSVLEVTKEAFESCNTTSPVAKPELKEGETKVKLTRAGPHYFVSGAQGHCEKGQKVEIVVLSPRHHHSHLAPSPAPSPSELLSPALAPTTGGALGLRAGFLGLVVGFLVVLGLF